MHVDRVTLDVERFPTRDKYPFSLETLTRTPEIVFEAPLTVFVGENGTGKSTLLRALTRRCGIHIWANPDCHHVEVNPHEEELRHYLDVSWTAGPVHGSFFSSEHFRYFSERVEDCAGADPALFQYFGGKSLLAQSHGQSLMSFFDARYRIEGIYFLDEPETALLPRRQLELLRLLCEMSRAGHAQFVVATHSPILMSCPEAVIL
ncbi:MAG: AAA family ATPase, partial [Acidobacteria bacterium]